MTSAQVVETSVTNNSSSQNYTHPDDHTIRTTDTPGLKPFTKSQEWYQFMKWSHHSLFSTLNLHDSRMSILPWICIHNTAQWPLSARQIWFQDQHNVSILKVLDNVGPLWTSIQHRLVLLQPPGPRSRDQFLDLLSLPLDCAYCRLLATP